MTTKQVSLRLDAQQKEDWEDFIEDSPEVSAMSQLIRRSVTQFIATDGDVPTATHVETEGSSEEVLDAIGQLESEVRGLSERLEAVEDEVRASPRRNVLNNAVFEELPNDGSVPITFEDLVINATGDMGAATEVRDVIENLVENSGVVKSQEDGDTTYYWKNV